MSERPRPSLTADGTPTGELPPLARERLAAQASGDVDAIWGGLAPPINPSTNYEMQADGT